MSYEDAIIRRLDKKLENKLSDSDFVNLVHEQVTKTIDSERPNPIDFKGIVDPQHIRDDAKKVRELEEIWALENDESAIEAKKKADIAEYLIYKNFSTWTEYRAVSLISAKADDYLRGIDLLIESEDPENQDIINHLGLGVDIALVGEKRADIESKKLKMKKNLDNGYLTEARYVSGGKFEGSLRNLPYTILSISSEHVNDLISAVNHKLPTEKEKKHILKYIVAYQIMRQLGAYYNFSKSKGFEDAADQYGLANNFATEIFSELISDLQNDPEIWKQVSNDVGVKEIEKFCSELETEIGL
jgi:hypothetical protein